MLTGTGCPQMLPISKQTGMLDVPTYLRQEGGCEWAEPQGHSSRGQRRGARGDLPEEQHKGQRAESWVGRIPLPALLCRRNGGVGNMPDSEGSPVLQWCVDITTQVLRNMQASGREDWRGNSTHWRGSQ